MPIPSHCWPSPHWHRNIIFNPQVAGPQGTQSHACTNSFGNTTYEVRNASHLPNGGGGNIIYYLGGIMTPTTDLSTLKVLLNSSISVPVARSITTDIINFYLNSPIDRYEKM